jgi:hypothetical protein
VAIGGLLCFRHRRIGMLALAATCAGVALSMVVTQIAEGDRTTGDVLTAAGLAFSPVIGTVLACAIIGIARLLWAITRRTVRAIRTFGGNVITDVCRIAKRPGDQERGPRRLSKASRLSVTFLVFTGIMLVGLKIGAISAVLTRVAPRLSVVTNSLDVISIILMTPKLFTIEADVPDLKIQPTRSFTFNKIIIPRNIFTPLYLATLIIFIVLMNKYLADYNASQLPAICASFNKILANSPASILASSVCDYVSKHVIEIQMVSTKMWSSFLRPLMFLSGFVVFSLTLLRLLRAIAKSPEAQEKLDDMALVFGLAVFVYSRALSMMG